MKLLYFWIGYNTTTAEDIYWTDKSYIEVSENIATKVSYSGNHSAIRIDSEWYQSKWGSDALVKHHPNDVPVGYQATMPKHYYIRAPTITGPDVISSNSISTYKVSNIPPNTPVSWSVSPGLLIVSSSSDHADVGSSSDTNFGGWVQATFSINGNPTSIIKNNIVTWRSGIQTATVAQQIMKGGVSTHGGDFSLIDPATSNYFDYRYGTNFVWRIDFPWSAEQSQGYPMMHFGGDTYCGPFYVTVDFTDAFGYQSTVYRQFDTDCLSYYLSPNPASAEVSVEVLDNAGSSSGAASATEPTYTVQITDMLGNPAYHGKKNGKKFNLSVSSLKNGVYNVTVSDGEKTGHEKLIVKH